MQQTKIFSNNKLMKKFILFTVVLYVLFLVSFKENSREPESFAKILKDHPDRLGELLKVASVYKDTSKILEDLLNSEDILSPKQLKDFRSKARDKKGDKKKPVIIISTRAINQLIQSHLNEKDSLVFFLGEYSKKDLTRVQRYNDRNTRKHNFGKDTLTLETLDKRVAFAMQVFSNTNPKEENSKTSTGLFNPENIIGSLGKGNYDFEKNDRQNNFTSIKTAVSKVYEISRLCPPPPEGCFK